MTEGPPFFKFNEIEIYVMPGHPDHYWVCRDGEGMQIKKDLLRYFLIGVIDTLETVFKELM